jgi:hypothetical protein
VDTGIGLNIFAPDDTQQAPLGSIVEYQTPSNGLQFWRYIKNESGGNFAAGEVIAQEATTDFNKGIKAPTTTAVPRLLGVAQYAIADTQFGWVLVSGIGEVMADTAGITANFGVMTGAATAGRAQDFAAGAGVEERAFAFAADTAAAGALATCKIAIPL